MTKNKIKTPMKNITINIPELYDENIQKLIRLKLIPSRSEAVRIAIREYLQREFDTNLEILGFFDEIEEEIEQIEVKQELPRGVRKKIIIKKGRLP